MTFKGTPTTRCYPRSLAEAFPKDIENFQWFFPPERNYSLSNIAMGMAALCLWVWIGFLLSAN